MEEQLIADLRADVGVVAASATYNGRAAVDWLTRPDTADLPGLVLQVVAVDPLYVHGGRDALTMKRVQFDCFALSYGEAVALYRAALAKMEAGGTGWRSFLVTERDYAPEDTPGGERIFRKMADFNIWYEE